MLTVFFTGCGSYGTVVYSDGAENTSEEASSEDAQDNTEADGSQCAVYVCGAVVSSGVYYLPQGSIKQDALLAAGGFAEGASEEYVNLAERVTDGEKLYIPYEDELDASGEYSETSEASSDGRVNINTADKDELMTLAGIGEGKADAIITYREENGRFSTAEDIMKVPGIKEATFENIKDCITVD